MVYNLRRKRANCNRGSMKRQCCICKNEYRYDKVKLRGHHKVKICVFCLNVITAYVRDDIDYYGL